MKNLIVLAVAGLFATNAVAAEMKWSGSTGWRYSHRSVDDNLNSKAVVTPSIQEDVSTRKTRAHQMRANLGVMGGWENVEYGFGVRTTTAGVANSDYTTFGNNGDLGLGIEQAWFRYVRDFGSLDMGVTIGRQKNALITDSAWQTHLDNDVRFDGFGWNFKFGMFGFNAAQYILGVVSKAGATGTTGASTMTNTAFSQEAAATSQSFATLFAFQPHMTWKFSDEIEALFAIAFYKWNYEGATNTSSGGFAGNTAPGALPAITPIAYRMDNKGTWDVLANVSLPYKLTFVGNYVKSNKAVADSNSIIAYPGTTANMPELGSGAWTLGLTYGKLRKAHDFTLGYAYGTKGLASVIGAFSNDRFLPDNKGHTVVAGYSIADNFNMGFRWINIKERENLDLSSIAPNLTGRPYGGNNANQNTRTSYWEVTAGVAF